MVGARQVGVVGLVVVGFAAFAVARDYRRVRMEDRCEPVSFNAGLRPGACVGDGDVTLQELREELGEKQEHGAWRFSPEDTDVESGEPLKLVNIGGEEHTFTKVAQFGGGFIPPLNALSGGLTPVPECATFDENGTLIRELPSASNVFLHAGGEAFMETGPYTDLPPGTHLIQCCFHPWMRMTVHVR